jgi:hypothetical protein
MPQAKQTAAEAAEAAFSDMVKKATAQFFDCLITSAGDAQQEAGCKARYEAALTTFRNGRQTTDEVVSGIFPEFQITWSRIAIFTSSPRESTRSLARMLA